MDEEMLKEMAASLREIKERLALGPAGAPPGSIAGWQGYANKVVRWDWLRGPVADPEPGILLDKPKLAQLKIHRLETVMSDLQKEIDSLKLERDLLRKEYKLR